jgi:hypothetical protein
MANYHPPVEEEAARKAKELIAEFERENPDADRLAYGRKELGYIRLISTKRT